MGKDLSNVYDLIRPLRARYLGPLRYIVILYPHDIPTSIWRRISCFQAILFVRGSSLEDADIMRAGIFAARQVVILADSSVHERAKKIAGRGQNPKQIESLVDSDAVFTFQCVKRLNREAQVVMEIFRHENIAYLDSSVTSSDYKFNPYFASGTLFTTHLLDSLVCQVCLAISLVFSCHTYTFVYL